MKAVTNSGVKTMNRKQYRKYCEKLWLKWGDYEENSSSARKNIMQDNVIYKSDCVQVIRPINKEVSIQPRRI